MKTSPRRSGHLIEFAVALLLILLCCSSRSHAAIDWKIYTPPVTPIEINDEAITKQFYVSPTGDDTLDGLAFEKSGTTGPFATLERARDAIRKLKLAGGLPKGGVAINLLGGVYSLNQSFDLIDQDSGTADAPIVYRAAKNATPRLAGGKVLKATDFSPVKDKAILERLAPEAAGKIMELDLKKLGLKHTGPFPAIFSDGGGIFEFFFNGERMKLSRWPYQDYTTMKEVTVIGDKTAPGSFVYREEEPSKWHPANGVWLKGQWRVGWEDPAMKVGSITTTNHQITFATPLGSGIGSKYKRTQIPYGSGQEKWCAINLLEEIKHPGQWCIDFNSQKLYFWPTAEIEKADMLVSQLDQPLVTVTGASNVAFIGITFEGSLGDGIVMKTGKQNLIAGCNFQNLGGNGVLMNGMGCGIQSCDMHDLGKGCILLSGGDRLKLIPSGNYVANNHLHDYAKLKAQYSAAINTQMSIVNQTSGGSAIGCLIAHNLIHHAPRDAVLYGGNDMVFEYNEIHRCAFDTADTGAFYAWLDWTIRGVVIRYNYIHDTVGGVNPDDGAGGALVFGNIFQGERIGVWIASGPDHTIENNIFIKNKGPVFGMDDRGVGRKYATNPKLLKGIQEINPTQPPWSERYPEMVHLLEEHPELPLRTAFTRNLIFIKEGDPFNLKMSKEHNANPALIKIDGNLVTNQDPGFVNLATGNLQLKSGSEVFTKIPGFQPIPFDKMGLYIDKYRKKLPTPSEAGRLPEQNPWKATDTDRNFGT